VVLNFENVNYAIWSKIEQYKSLFDDITFPMIIKNKLSEQNLTLVFYSDSKLEFDSSAPP
jgi:hypothetical protein